MLALIRILSHQISVYMTRRISGNSSFGNIWRYHIFEYIRGPLCAEAYSGLLMLRGLSDNIKNIHEQ